MAYRKMTIPTSADWEESWTWWDLDPDTGAKVQAKNLTGWTGIWQFRARYGSPVVLAEISTANGRMVLGDGEGNIAVSLPHAVLVPLGGKESVMNCVLIDPEGQRHELFPGEAEFEPSATE